MTNFIEKVGDEESKIPTFFILQIKGITVSLVSHIVINEINSSCTWKDEVEEPIRFSISLKEASRLI
jgi:hypothetical protein